MNDMIRADTSNQLRMRTPFRACDKKLLIDAAYEPEPEYVQSILRAKILIEPGYHAYVLDHPESVASPMEKQLLDHHEWPADEERREGVYHCAMCAPCTCPNCHH